MPTNTPNAKPKPEPAVYRSCGDCGAVHWVDRALAREPMVCLKCGQALREVAAK